METDSQLNAPAAVPPGKEISVRWIKGWVDPKECTDVWQPQPNATRYLFGLDFALGLVYIAKRLVHDGNSLSYYEGVLNILSCDIRQ